MLVVHGVIVEDKPYALVNRVKQNLELSMLESSFSLSGAVCAIDKGTQTKGESQRDRTTS
jgi:hypothetical protein